MTSLLTGTFETQQRKKLKAQCCGYTLETIHWKSCNKVLTTENVVQQLPTSCNRLHHFHHNTLIDHSFSSENTREFASWKKKPLKVTIVNITSLHKLVYTLCTGIHTFLTVLGRIYKKSYVIVNPWKSFEIEKNYLFYLALTHFRQHNK